MSYCASFAAGSNGVFPPVPRGGALTCVGLGTDPNRVQERRCGASEHEVPGAQSHTGTLWVWDTPDSAIYHSGATG